MREVLVLSGDASGQKQKTEARQKAPSFIHACRWKMELFAFPEPGTNCGTSNLDIHWLRNPRESNGNRLFPWHTILLARSSMLYCSPIKSSVSLPGAKSWKRCLFEANTKFFLILFLSRKSIIPSTTAGTGSGRDRPAHRQRQAAVRKRVRRNLRAMPARRFCSGRVASRKRAAGRTPGDTASPFINSCFLLIY